jgi:hypothetical protein
MEPRQQKILALSNQIQLSMTHGKLLLELDRHKRLHSAGGVEWIKGLTRQMGLMTRIKPYYLAHGPNQKSWQVGSRGQNHVLTMCIKYGAPILCKIETEDSKFRNRKICTWLPWSLSLWQFSSKNAGSHTPRAPDEESPSSQVLPRFLFLPSDGIDPGAMSRSELYTTCYQNSLLSKLPSLSLSSNKWSILKIGKGDAV